MTIQRYDITGRGSAIETRDNGDYVRYDDHAAEVAAKDAEIAEIRQWHARLAKSIGAEHLSSTAKVIECAVAIVERVPAEVAAAVAREREDILGALLRARDLFSEGATRRTYEAAIRHIESRPTPGAAKEV